jgi:hypothetical protein
MNNYAYKKVRKDKTYYYRSDIVTERICTDEAAESEHRGTTTIVFWEGDDED